MDPMESWFVLMISIFIFVVGYPMWSRLLTFEETSAQPEVEATETSPIADPGKHAFMVEDG